MNMQRPVPFQVSYPCLEDRRVLVTGGASGIGEAIAEAFARQGAYVGLIDNKQDAAKAVADRLSDECKHAPVAMGCDLTDIRALQSTMDAMKDHFAGPITVLVNNAANDDRHTIDEVTPEYWDERIAVNLRHQFFCAQAVLPGMRTAGYGSIINLGSISWHLGMSGLPIYVTSKAAITGMTRALARDEGPHNIRVNCLVPGAVKTERQMKLWTPPEVEERILEDQCLKSRVEPHHIAAMALFLGSDQSAMCTGHEYFVDAGWK